MSSNFKSSSLFPDPSIPVFKRKRTPRKETVEEELLAFGYEIKIYHDHELATKIDSGSFLIPWNSSDSNLLMDRYDVRHLLHDVTQLQTKQKAILDAEFDDDRYIDLYGEADDENKRSGVTIPYDYGESSNKKLKFSSAFENEIKSRYKTPALMNVPSTEAQLVLMETIAKKVGSSNLLEIRIQVNNANDPLYSFLNKGDRLYPFYKHLGSYKPERKLVAYSDSDGSSSSSENEQEIPSELKNMIQKTARSIAKSTNNLEQHLRSLKGHEEKFSFLNKENEYYPYFKSQIRKEEKKQTNK